MAVPTISLKRYAFMARGYYKILYTQHFCFPFVFLFTSSFGQNSFFYLFISFYFSFTIYWKARNKLLHYDLSVAFSIGTLMVGYLSFCWEGIDFLSLLLGKPCFHLFH